MGPGNHECGAGLPRLQAQLLVRADTPSITEGRRQLVVPENISYLHHYFLLPVREDAIKIGFGQQANNAAAMQI
jgi:hypothetical protein